ncbi:MAG TPA: hypothetical protein PLM07_19505 [Candidatus Rifleibacterium sp.]|nr:hypothetical protein [Candidatus Rifleibacterium sp.]HPT48075.1 hypothetical protein [Candidatus Rifleibacterium sp.]
MNLTSRIQKKYLFHRIVGLLLIAVMLGVSPGIFEAISPVQAAGTPFTEAKVAIDKDNPLAVSSATGTSASASATIAADSDDSFKKKEMSKAEEIAWSIGKALLPTLAVMAFSAAVVCPLAWVVIGAVVVGATAAGALTMAYELRKNSFRNPGEKKAMDKILREVSIQAAVSGAMAPFNMLTGGLVQTVGPLTVKTIVQTAAKAGAVSFLGSTVSNVAKGTVTNLWYDHYYNYDEREKQLNEKIKRLSAISDPTTEEQNELVAALKDLDTIKKEKYTWDNFRKDETKAMVSAGISGVLGGIAGRLGAESSWAKIASSKLFGSTSKANLLSNAVISNPFAFATGAASAAVDKKEILNQIAYNRQVQSKYAKGSPAWNYYEGKIIDLETAYKSVSLSEAGKSAMLSNAAQQVAVVGTSLAKTRLWDLPSQKRQKVQQAYEEQDADWQKANEVRQRLEIRKANRPQPAEYSTKSEYSKALKQYTREVNSLRTEYQAAKAQASDAQSSASNKQVVKEIQKQVSGELEYARQSELARALGRENYVEFKMKELGKNPENEGLSEIELRQKANAEVAKGYEDAAKANALRLATMEEKANRQTQELLGKVEKGNDGKHYVVVTDEKGVEVMRTEYKSGEGAFWAARIKGGTAAEMKQAEIDAVVRRAYNSSAMVKPTSFRNEYVNMRVNQLRAEGMSESQIDRKLGGIVDEANGKMLTTYGGWNGVAKSEMLAAGLEKAKYDDGAAPDAGKIVDFLKRTLTNKTISTVESELSGNIQNGLAVVAPKTGYSRIDPLKPLLDSEERDAETLNRLTEKAMRDYYNKRP